MQSNQGGGKPFIIAREAAEAARPGEAALHDPSFGKQDEAALRQWGREDDQLNACSVARAVDSRPV